VQLLRQVGQALVEIHGQHDDRALIDPSGHRELGDAFGGLSADAAGVAAAYAAWQDADAERARHDAEIAATRANADYVAHALEELRTLDPQPGEEEALASRRQLMMHAEKLAGELSEALDALAGEGTSGARLAAALRRVERQASIAPHLLTPVAEALARVLAETEDARGKIEQALAASAFEPNDLERAEERLFALRALARKHRLTVDDLAALTQRLEVELAALDTSEARAGELAKAADTARKSYAAKALALSKARLAAAKRLDREVMGELGPLKLERASFITNIETVDPGEGGPSGIDRIAFFVRTNPGTEPGPLMKVASGGELARFILALKVVLAARGSAPTLVFDEADSGVGGATAAAVGERLAKLASRVQVLAVTHAPPVAAVADGPMLIVKEMVRGARGEAMVTRVAALAGAHRREEIARMLAGQTITDEARAAAARLMSRSA
jgi:DNA repair protein RecN (Recombination protein N)